MPGHILVLDDEESYARMLCDLLQDRGFFADMSSDPAQALEQLEKTDYALVVTDFKMPVLDGSDFLVKARELKPNLPVIMISGLMNTPELIRVANLGVTVVLEKPFSADDFLGHVSRFVTPGEDEAISEDVADAVVEYEQPLEDPEVSFPGTDYLAASGFNGRRWVEDLWKRAEAARIVFVDGPSGSEFTLVAKEVAHWFGLDPARVRLMDADVFAQESTWTMLQKEPSVTGGSVILVSSIERAGIDALEFLARFVASIYAKPDLGFGRRFVFSFDRRGFVTPEQRGASLTGMALDRGVRIPALCDRPEDLAVYIRQFLDEAERALGSRPELTPEAAAALLTADWPRNYQQLQLTLRTLIRNIGTQTIDGDAVAQALQEAPLDDAEANPLIQYLLARQERWIQARAGLPDGVRQTIAESLGVSLEEFDEMITEAPDRILCEDLVILHS